MYDSGTVPGLFSFTRLTALVFSVWVSLSSGSNYVCHTPFWDWNVADLFGVQVVGGEFVILTPPSRECTYALLMGGFAPSRHSTPLLALGGVGFVSSICNGAYFVASMYSTCGIFSVPSAIRRASSSHTYPTKRVRRCWQRCGYPTFPFAAHSSILS